MQMNLKTSSVSITMNNCVSSYEFYQQYHTHYFNKICHFVSIPMIIVCTMTFLRDIVFIGKWELYDICDPKSRLSFLNELYKTDFMHASMQWCLPCKAGGVVVPKLPFNYVSLNRVIMVGYLLYYMSYGWWVGVLMWCYFDGLYRVATRMKMRMWVASGVLWLGWMVQFMGHYVGGKRPARMDSVGQAFLAAQLFAVSDVLMMVW